MAGADLKDTRHATPFNPAGVSARDIPENRVAAPAQLGLVQRGMPNAVTMGKQWGGNVGPKATRGTGEAKPGKVSRDVGPWGGNVAPHITSGKPSVGAKSP